MEASAPGGASASDAFGIFAGSYSAEPFNPVRKRRAAAEGPNGSDDEEVSPEYVLIAAFLYRSGNACSHFFIGPTKKCWPPVSG